jgi:hypothetical protein
MESCSFSPRLPSLDGVKLQLTGRTGLSVQAGSHKFPLLRSISLGSAHHAKCMALLIKLQYNRMKLSNWNGKARAALRTAAQL